MAVQLPLLILLGLCSAGMALELFEGDIVMTDDVRKVVSGVGGYGAQVNGHWPNGVVPYTFHRDFDRNRRTLVQAAIDDYNSNTCIRFVSRTNQQNYVQFIVGQGCYSRVGVQGNRQDISIGNGCTSHGTIIHEMMHAIGFWHEQSRRDRDQYVNIYWNNIPKNMRYNFDKYVRGQAITHNEPYDFGSVMHYENTAFGNGRVTIAAKEDPRKVLGQRIGFSANDLRQINKMYSCNIAPPNPNACTDSNTNCLAWALRGECNINPAYMNDNCKRSCNQCPGCKDHDGNCRAWASTGECRKNPKFMKPNCMISCNVC